jgi:hypothetical protein
MNNRDVEELFPLVQVGVHVEISTAPATKFTKLMSAD